MVGSLSASLQFAKGLAVAWNRPLIGVHHMLGHLLVANMPSKENATPPSFPFLSLLCSGGHTMLVLLRSLSDHEIIINTIDIAGGDSIDKCARELGLSGNMLGPVLEKYVQNIDEDRKEKFKKAGNDNEYGFLLTLPMRSARHKRVPDDIEFAFASFLSTLERFKKTRGPLDEETHQFVAYKLQETIFDHIVNRINIAFIKHGNSKFAGVQDFVCSGGVAANSVLRQKLKALPGNLQFHFPALALCTDNATMIGVAGIELFEKLRIKSPLDILPIRRWPMDQILGVNWDKVTNEEFKKVTGW